MTEIIPTICITEMQLVDVYHEMPELLEKVAIKVNLTEGSYRQQTGENIYLKRSVDDVYWLLATNHETYWLFPKYGLRINPAIMDRNLDPLYNCLGLSSSRERNFNVNRPARLSLLPNGKEWKLEERGELDFRERSPSSQLLRELKNIKEERQQIINDIKQLKDNYWQIKYELEELQQQRQNLQIQLEQMQAQIQQLSRSLDFSDSNEVKTISPLSKSSRDSIDLKKIGNTFIEYPASTPWQNTRLIITFKNHQHLVKTLAISNNNYGLISGSFDHTLKIWNLKTGQLLKTLSETGQVHAIALCNQGKTLFSSSTDKTIKVWNINLYQVEQILQEHDAWVRCLALSKDGKTLFSGNDRHQINVWQRKNTHFYLFSSLKGHQDSVLAIAINPLQETLISASADQTLKMWNLRTYELLYTFTGHRGPVSCLAITAKGETLISGSFDETLKIWDVNTGNLKSTLEGHEKGVWGVATHPDGQILASGGGDNKIKLWHLANNKLLCELRTEEKGIYDLKFTPDGRKLISGGQDGSIRIWGIDTHI